MARQYELKKVILLLGLIACSPRETNIISSVSHDYSLYADGDIICRYGNGYFSQLFRNVASKDRLYSHIGIVSIYNDSVFVYHAEASEFTGEGSVKREWLDNFLADITTYGLYRLQFDTETRARIVDRARFYQQRKTPFDADFNLTNDTTVYCTELVANCINYATNTNTIRAQTILNKKRVYGLDDIYGNSSIKQIMCIDRDNEE